MNIAKLIKYQELINSLTEDWEEVSKKLEELGDKLEEEKADGKE